MKRVLVGLLLFITMSFTTAAQGKTSNAPVKNYLAKLGKTLAENDPHFQKLGRLVDSHNGEFAHYQEMSEEMRKAGLDTTDRDKYFARNAPTTGAWFSTINALRPQVRKLRQIKVVPKSMKRADAAWVRYSLHMERTLNYFVGWRRGQNSADAAFANLDKSLKLFSTALDLTEDAKDATMNTKKYTNG